MSDEPPPPEDRARYHANQIQRGRSDEELKNLKSQDEASESRWYSLSLDSISLFQDLIAEIEKHKATGTDATFDHFYHDFGAAYALGEIGALADGGWEVRCEDDSRIQVGWAWEIDLSVDQIRDVAEGKNDRFELTPCQQEGCFTLVGRSEPWCELHGVIGGK